MKTARYAVASICLFATLGAAQAAPKITGVAASPAKVPVNGGVTISVRGEGLEDAICALKVDYGDGSSAVRKMDWGKKVIFPLKVKKQYARPGKYAVRVFGVKSDHYLKCLGQARATVTVTSPEPSNKP